MFISFLFYRCRLAEWLHKRHNLTKRITDNVKAARAEVNAEVLNSYFDRLKETLNEIPPPNVFNYDETNVTDDPGAQMVNSFIFIIISLRSLHLSYSNLDNDKQNALQLKYEIS